MTSINVTKIKNNYPHNFGLHAEQALAFTLTGEMRTPNSIPFYAGSDIPEFDMSVKSGGFTLASGRINSGDTLEEKIDDFMSRVPSKKFTYVTRNMVAYIMNTDEFIEFVFEFCKLRKDSK